MMNNKKKTVNDELKENKINMKIEKHVPSVGCCMRPLVF